MTPTTPRHVGFIGLGLMGQGLAANLQRAGHAVSLLLRHDADRSRCAALLQAGAQGLDSPAALAAVVDVLVLCVTGSTQVEQVVLGDNGVLAGARAGLVVVDCSTSQPASTRRLAELLRARGVTFVDAAMTGTPRDAEAGSVSLLLGGSADTVAALRPLLQAVAQNVYHCGDTGAGHTVKLLHQFVVLGNVALLAEAFSLARKSGVDTGVLGQVIASGGANSTAFQRLRAYIDEGNDDGFRFTVANALKDMRYYNQMGADSGAIAALGGAVLATYTGASNLGHGTRFVPHLLDSADQLNGLRPPNPP